MIRTHDAGTLRAEHVGQTVTLAGWVARRRDHGGVAFIDLREASGVAQVVIRDEAVAHQLRSEFCLKVTGEVAARPEGNANPDLPTGEIEVIATEVEVLNAAAAAAVPDRRARRRRGEEARLKHRYLDLRRTRPGRRASGCAARSTRPPATCSTSTTSSRSRRPTLTRSTPEGARDFLVPGPAAAGQLVRAAAEPPAVQAAADGRRHGALLPDRPLLPRRGLPRRPPAGVHPARHRDELRRARTTCIAVAEDVLARALGADRVRRADAAPADDLRRGDGPLRHRQARPADGPASWSTAPTYFKDTAVPGLPGARTSAPSSCPAAPASPASSSTPGRSGPSSAAPAGWPTCWSARTASSADRSPRTSPTRSGPGSPRTSAPSPGDCVFFAAGAVKASRALLGAARLEIGRRGGLIDEDAWSFLWVVDAPLFEPADEATAAGDVAVGGGAWTAVHHAFTSPQDRRRPSTRTPANALAWAYDIVCNGNEIGGGSIRIHREDVQKRVFAVMGIDEAEAQEKFGFLLDAFQYGAPPHGGIAFGWDRIVRAAGRRRLDPRRDRVPQVGRRLDPLTGARRRSPQRSARRPASTRPSKLAERHDRLVRAPETESLPRRAPEIA